MQRSIKRHHEFGTHVNGYRPRDVATELGISTEALRRCSVEFADLLSPGASAKGVQLGDAHEWRYTSQDIALLGAIRDFPVARHLAVGAGGLFSLNFVPNRIASLYGGTNPTGAMGFVRVKLN